MYAEHSMREIASKLGCSAAAVSSRFQRLKLKVRNKGKARRK